MALEREAWTDARLDDFRAEMMREFAVVRAETKVGFESVDKRFGEVDRRFDAIDKRFESVDKRFESIDKRFDAIDRRFEKVDRRFEAVGVEFVALRKEMKEGFDKLYWTLIWFCGSLLVAVVAFLFTH